MAFFDFLRRKPHRFDVTRGIGYYDSGFQGSTPWNMQGTGAANQLKLTAVWRAVNLIAGAIASMPCRYLDTEDGETEEIAPALTGPGQLAYLLQVKPNSFQHSTTFFNHVITSLMLKGEALIYKQRNSYGVITDLIPLNPDMVLFNFDSQSLTKNYTIAGDVYTDDDIIHIIHTTIDGIRGINPWIAHLSTFDTHFKMGQYVNRYFGNNATPAGVITTATDLTVDQMTKVKQSWSDSLAGVANTNKPAFLPPGWKFEKVSLNPEESQLLESRQFGIEDIARIYGIPLTKLSIGAQAGKTPNQTVEQEGLYFLQDTIDPILSNVESAFRAHLVSPELLGRFKISFDRETFIKTDITTFTTNLIAKVNAGLMTRNEGRRKLNLNPLLGLDSVQIQQGFSLVNSDGEVVPLNNAASKSGVEAEGGDDNPTVGAPDSETE